IASPKRRLPCHLQTLAQQSTSPKNLQRLFVGYFFFHPSRLHWFSTRGNLSSLLSVLPLLPCHADISKRLSSSAISSAFPYPFETLMNWSRSTRDLQSSGNCVRITC